MIGKRCAVLAVFSAALAKLAHADEPTKPDMWINPEWAKPSVWTINLDMVARINVQLGGERVTISREELFAALKG